MKEDKTGHIVILCVLTIVGLIVHRMINYTNQQEKTYEYALKQEIGVSSNCCYSDNAYCEIDNKVIKVDCYYLKED